MADEKPAAEEAPAGPKLIMGMPLPVFLFVVLNVVVIGGAFYFIVNASLIYKKPAITEEQAAAEVTKAEKKKAVTTGEEILTISYPEMTITLRGEQGGKTRKISDATIEAAITAEIRLILQGIKPNETLLEFMIREPVRAAVVLGWLIDIMKVKPDAKILH